MDRHFCEWRPPSCIGSFPVQVTVAGIISSGEVRWNLIIVEIVGMGTRMFRCFIILPLIFPSLFLGASQNNIRFRRLSIEQGLSQSSVFSITQDSKGFMWFATQDGIDRYDGYSFVHFQHEDDDSGSLSDNYVNVVMEDHGDTLWIGTRGGGLNRFVSSAERFVHYRWNAADPHSLSNDEVRCIYQDRSGTVWIGTSNGLDRYDRKTDSFIRYVHNAADRSSIPEGLVQCLYEDGNGNFWVGMLGSIARLDRKTGKFTLVSLPTPGILCVWISEDDSGNLWVAMQNGLYLYHDRKWRPASLIFRDNLPVLARVILRDHQGYIWFGADNGLNRWDERGKVLVTLINDPSNSLSISGNSILSLYEDRQGILWIGTYDGISKYASAEFKFRHVKWTSTSDLGVGWNKIRSFAEKDSTEIWVATQSGLMIYDRGDGTLTRFSNDSWYTPENNLRLLWSLLADHKSTLPALWVGTNGQGLIRLEQTGSDSYKFKKYLPRPGDPQSISGPNPVTLYETRDGTLWVGALWEGLNRYDRRTGKFVRYANDPGDPRSISGNEIWSVCEDHDGHLWVGTAGEGLNKLDTAAGVFTRYRHNPNDSLSLSDDKVTSIVEDTDGNLWIGTYTGLNMLNPATGLFKHYTTRDGLPNNVVYGIVDDREGNLWLSTNRGLSRFTIKTGQFHDYDAGDGLQENEFNYGAAYRCNDGEILFGGTNGFNIFYPDSLPKDTDIPTVVLTDFKVFNMSVHPSPADRRLTTDITDAGVVHLPFKDNVISFEFAALDYINPDKNQYAYKMIGFDKGWINAGSLRTATYTNLDPGSYVFEVRAANSDGVWNDKGASLKIIISPPYWETWWFRFMIALLLLSIGPLIYFRRVTSLKKEHTVQQEFSRRLIESQEAEKKRVAAELHDSIGQDLLVIKNKLLLGLQFREKRGEVTKDFEDAVDHVTVSLKHIREITRNLRPIQLDQIGLTAALESVIETAAESSNIQSTVNIDNIDNLLSKEGEINLFRILQESLNNILKHSQASSVNVKIVKTGNQLKMEVVDNGRGMEQRTGAPVKHSGFGLSGMYERARILGGELKVESTRGNGTVLTLIVPLMGNHNG